MPTVQWDWRQIALGLEDDIVCGYTKIANDFESLSEICKCEEEKWGGERELIKI
jgi:hypothetical protein